jgi:hypothetical protein
MLANIDELNSIPYEIIQDKALPNQDHLYKLIIIGDTGKSIKNKLIYVKVLVKVVCWRV